VVWFCGGRGEGQDVLACLIQVGGGAGALELDAGGDPVPDGRVGRSGRGRRAAEGQDPRLVPALLGLVEPDERGDSMSPLRWTAKSLCKLAGELTPAGPSGLGACGGPVAVPLRCAFRSAWAVLSGQLALCFPVSLRCAFRSACAVLSGQPGA